MARDPFITTATSGPLAFLGPPDESLRNPRCSFDLWIPAPDILVTHVNGFAEWADIRWYTYRADRIISTGQNLYIFHDFEGLTGYENGARAKLTEWAAKRKNFLPDTHFLIRSQIMAMAVSVASLALGRHLKAFASRREFEDVLQTMLASRPPLSLREPGPPFSLREGDGPMSAREGAGPMSTRRPPPR